jgi:hypothetical protein
MRWFTQRGQLLDGGTGLPYEINTAPIVGATSPTRRHLRARVRAVRRRDVLRPHRLLPAHPRAARAHRLADAQLRPARACPLSSRSTSTSRSGRTAPMNQDTNLQFTVSAVTGRSTSRPSPAPSSRRGWWAARCSSSRGSARWCARGKSQGRRGERPAARRFARVPLHGRGHHRQRAAHAHHRQAQGRRPGRGVALRAFGLGPRAHRDRDRRRARDRHGPHRAAGRARDRADLALPDSGVERERPLSRRQRLLPRAPGVDSRKPNLDVGARATSSTTPSAT